MYVVISHEEINNSLAALKTTELPEANAVQGNTLLSAAEFVVKVYRYLIPLVLVLSNTPLLNPSWSAGFTLLAQAIEALQSAVTSATSSSAAESLASDTTTTTDPTSTDPSFKAGKDL